MQTEIVIPSTIVLENRRLHCQLPYF